MSEAPQKPHKGPLDFLKIEMDLANAVKFQPELAESFAHYEQGKWNQRIHERLVKESVQLNTDLLTYQGKNFNNQYSHRLFSARYNALAAVEILEALKSEQINLLDKDSIIEEYQSTEDHAQWARKYPITNVAFMLASPETPEPSEQHAFNDTLNKTTEALLRDMRGSYSVHLHNKSLTSKPRKQDKRELHLKELTEQTTQLHETLKRLAPLCDAPECVESQPTHAHRRAMVTLACELAHAACHDVEIAKEVKHLRSQNLPQADTEFQHAGPIETRSFLTDISANSTQLTELQRAMLTHAQSNQFIMKYESLRDELKNSVARHTDSTLHTELAGINHDISMLDSLVGFAQDFAAKNVSNNTITPESQLADALKHPQRDSNARTRNKRFEQTDPARASAVVVVYNAIRGLRSTEKNTQQLPKALQDFYTKDAQAFMQNEAALIRTQLTHIHDALGDYRIDAPRENVPPHLDPSWDDTKRNSVFAEAAIQLSERLYRQLDERMNNLEHSIAPEQENLGLQR